MKKILIIAIISLVALFLSLLTLERVSSPNKIYFPTSATPTPVANPEVTFKTINFSQIFTDPSIAQGMQDKLQNPTKKEQEGGYDIYTFPDTTSATTSALPTQVYTKSGYAQYVVEVINQDNTLYSDYKNSHSEQPTHLYDFYLAESGFDWYVYPDQGVAFLANDNAGYALKILYFPPTTTSDFLNSAGKTFSIQTTTPDEKGSESFQ